MVKLYDHQHHMTNNKTELLYNEYSWIVYLIKRDIILSNLNFYKFLIHFDIIRKNY